MKTLLLIATTLALVGCNQIPKAVTASSKAVKGMRQGITIEMDGRCSVIAKACPKATADAKLADCKKYVECRDLRRTLYKATNAYQIACHTALGLYEIGKKEEATKLWLGLGMKMLQLKQLLTKHKILGK